MFSAMPSTEAQLDFTIDDGAAAHAREQGGVLTIRTRAPSTGAAADESIWRR